MRHRATPRFWECYHALPLEIQQLADQAYERLKQDPHYPALHFKRVGRFWSARVGIHYRVLALDMPEGPVWFWIGTHAEYDRLIG